MLVKVIKKKPVTQNTVFSIRQTAKATMKNGTKTVTDEKKNDDCY